MTKQCLQNLLNLLPLSRNLFEYQTHTMFKKVKQNADRNLCFLDFREKNAYHNQV
jgi:hypothetical protein